MSALETARRVRRLVEPRALAALHALLRDAGFRTTGETPIIPGGAARYVWARA